MDDPLEKKWQRKLRDKDKTRQLIRDQFIKAALGTREGRDYFWWLLEVSGLNHNPHTSNALNTAFNCGQMNVGQQLLAHIMTVAPEGYFNMLKEREKEKNDVDAERAELESRSYTEPGELTASDRPDAESSI